MSTNETDHVRVATVEDPEPPRRRADAVPYISYKSLLCTARAVRHERVTVKHNDQLKVCHDLVLAFAGDREDIDHYNGGARQKRIRYQVGKDAKEGMHLQMQNLRKAKSDAEFNRVQIAFLTAIRDAQMGVTYQHVHDCERKSEDCQDCDGSGRWVNNPSENCGACDGKGHPPCTWNWEGHRADPEDPTCPCGTTITDQLSESNGRFIRMVVHQGDEQ